MEEKLHFKFFTSDEDFVVFQAENKIAVHSITPFNKSISFKMDEGNADGNVIVGAFVVFRYK